MGVMGSSSGQIYLLLSLSILKSDLLVFGPKLCLIFYRSDIFEFWIYHTIDLLIIGAQSSVIKKPFPAIMADNGTIIFTFCNRCFHHFWRKMLLVRTHLEAFATCDWMSGACSCVYVYLSLLKVPFIVIVMVYVYLARIIPRHLNTHTYIVCIHFANYPPKDTVYAINVP